MIIPRVSLYIFSTFVIYGYTFVKLVYIKRQFVIAMIPLYWCIYGIFNLLQQFVSPILLPYTQYVAQGTQSSCAGNRRGLDDIKDMPTLQFYSDRSGNDFMSWGVSLYDLDV